VAPPLPEDSQKVLRVLLSRPVLVGAELAILAGLDEGKLLDAVTPLLSAGLISANTPSIDPNELPKAYFNLNPSARRFAEFAVR